MYIVTTFANSNSRLSILLTGVTAHITAVTLDVGQQCDLLTVQLVTSTPNHSDGEGELFTRESFPNLCYSPFLPQRVMSQCRRMMKWIALGVKSQRR